MQTVPPLPPAGPTVGRIRRKDLGGSPGPTTILPAAAVVVALLALPPACTEPTTALLVGIHSASHPVPERVDAVRVEATLRGEPIPTFQAPLTAFPYSVALADPTGKGGEAEVVVTLEAAGRPVARRAFRTRLTAGTVSRAEAVMDRCDGRESPPLGYPGPGAAFPGTPVVVPGRFGQDAFPAAVAVGGARAAAEPTPGGLVFRLPPEAGVGEVEISVQEPDCSLVRWARRPLRVLSGPGHVEAVYRAARIELADMEPTSVAVTFDARVAAVGGRRDGQAEVLSVDLASATAGPSFRSPEPSLGGVALAPTGTLGVATSGRPACKALVFAEDLSAVLDPAPSWVANPTGGTARLCDLGRPFFEPGRDIPFFPDRQRRIWRLTLEPDDGTVGVEELLGPGNVEEPLAYAGFDADGRRLLAVSAPTGRLVAWRVSDWVRICRIPLCDGDECHGEEVRAASLSPKGDLLVVLSRRLPPGPEGGGRGGEGGAEGEPQDESEVDGAILRSFHLSRSPAAGDGCDLQAIPGYEWPTLPPPPGTDGGLLLSPDGTRALLAVATDGDLRMVDLSAPDRVTALLTGLAQVTAVDSSADGRHILVVGREAAEGGPSVLVHLKAEP